MKQPGDRISDEIKGKKYIEVKQAKEEEQEIDALLSINCDCCKEASAAVPPSSPIHSMYLTLATEIKSGESASIDDHDHESHDEDYGESKREILFNNTKLLIAIGIAATAPIVFLELLSADSLVNISVVLALATTVQILLGRPFYIRFFKAIKNRKRLTTDTLVVLSTSLAYFYSIINMFTGSNLQFFEASSSVLTIFTIGEYLETRVLRTTSESLRNLLALKPKYAVIIRDGRQQEINSDEVAIGDI
ncbi:MAG: hypothetical protein ACRD8W_01085, partial [Nitrososphaeraceae archaeon]